MKKSNTQIEALDRAVRAVGTVAALAERIGVSQSLPSMWRARKRVPAQHCPAIEKATAGVVRCENLRPDIEWSVLRNSPPELIGQEPEAKAA